jgi:hypothetical protein
MLDEFIEWMKTFEGVWMTTGAELANYIRQE